MTDKKFTDHTQPGRISRSAPNLQNIPIRSPEGCRVSHIFHKLRPFIEGDYAATEAQVLAAMSPEAVAAMFGDFQQSRAGAEAPDE